MPDIITADFVMNTIRKDLTTVPPGDTTTTPYTITHMECEDTSDGCGSKFKLTVVSDAFIGLPLLAQQRLVNSALKTNGLMDKIHAITMKTKTPEQWAKQQGAAA